MDNKQRYLELCDSLWNRGEVGKIDQWVAADYKRTDPSMQARGAGGMAKIVSTIHEGLSKVDYRVEHIIGEGEYVAARWTLSGVHTGELFGHRATGRAIAVTGNSMCRFVDGKIDESWLNWDYHGLLEQLR